MLSKCLQFLVIFFFLPKIGQEILIRKYGSEIMNSKKIIEKLPLHYKCRNSIYPKSTNVFRFIVSDDKVSWNIKWPEYSPVTFNSPAINNKPWSDPPIGTADFKPKWNMLDGNVNRKSHFAEYEIGEDGCPLNPCGRTGIKGRGCLGRWGPNHAADSVLTRWKRNSDSEIELNKTTSKPILQFVAIERKDSHEWAIPGGMVDPGESVSVTLKREFMEEALNIMSLNKAEREKRKKLVDEFFSQGLEIYKGYVDDPRNTDNAWMETVVSNFHDESGNYARHLDLSGGDDALNAKWLDINSDLVLYASHKNFIEKIALLRQCHW